MKKRLLSLLLVFTTISTILLSTGTTAYAATSDRFANLNFDNYPSYVKPPTNVPEKYKYFILSDFHAGAVFLICSTKPIFFRFKDENAYNSYFLRYFTTDADIACYQFGSDNKINFYDWSKPEYKSILKESSFLDFCTYLQPSSYGSTCRSFENISSNYSIPSIDMPLYTNYKVSVSGLDSKITPEFITVNFTNSSVNDMTLILNISKIDNSVSSSLRTSASVYTYAEQVSGLSLLQGMPTPDFSKLVRETDGADGIYNKKLADLQAAFAQKDSIQKNFAAPAAVGAVVSAGIQYIGDWWKDTFSLTQDAASAENERKRLEAVNQAQSYLDKLNAGSALYANGNNIGVGKTQTFNIPVKNLNLISGNTYYFRVFVSFGKFLKDYDIYNQFYCIYSSKYFAPEMPEYVAPPYGSGNVNVVDSYNTTTINNYYNNVLPPMYIPEGGGSTSSTPDEGGGSTSSTPDEGGGSTSSTPDEGGGSTSSTPDEGGGSGSGNWWDGLLNGLGGILDFLGSAIGFIGKILGNLGNALMGAFNGIMGIFNTVTSFFSFLGGGLSFLPPEIWTILIAAVAVCVVLRIFGR